MLLSSEFLIHLCYAAEYASGMCMSLSSEFLIHLRCAADYASAMKSCCTIAVAAVLAIIAKSASGARSATGASACVVTILSVSLHDLTMCFQANGASHTIKHISNQCMLLDTAKSFR